LQSYFKRSILIYCITFNFLAMIEKLISDETFEQLNLLIDRLKEASSLTDERFLRIACVDMAIRSGIKDIYVTSAAQDIYEYISTGKTVKIGHP